MKNLYILDGLSFLFRSYFAIKGMTNRQGESTNALYGFIRSIQKIQKDFSPDNLVVVFDGTNNKQMRTTLYQDYKSNRKKMAADLVSQLKWTYDFCEAKGIPYLSVEGVEGDDLIGVIAKWGEKKGLKVFICSNDKDLCQLISNNVFMINIYKSNLLIDPTKVEELYGVKPEQMVDYLAIVGDKSDNIPGIPRFGPKTAASLLKKYGSLDNIIDNLDTMENQKQANAIRIHIEDARLSQKLATLILDITHPHEETFYQIKPFKMNSLKNLYHEMNFHTLLKELTNEIPIIDEEKEKHGTSPSYDIIDSERELLSLIKELNKQSSICISIQSNRTSPMTSYLIGIGLCVDCEKIWYIPTNGHLGLDKVIVLLKPLLENSQIAFYGHNIKYDIHVLKNHDIHLHTIDFDTMIASYLLTPQNHHHDLDAVTLETFEKVKSSIQDLTGSGKQKISIATIPIKQLGSYCCEGVYYTYRLRKFFEKKIADHNLEDVFYNIELPLIPILINMERHGVYLKKEKLEHLSNNFQKI